MTTKRKSVRRTKPATRRSAGRSGRAALSVATSQRHSVNERVAAMAEATSAVCSDDGSLQSMLNVLRDPDEHVKVRLAALASLQAASFSVIAFAPCRSDYIATLRSVAVDTDPEVRRRALSILAGEKDGFAQRKLIEGLEAPAKALVAPEKALQLLAQDVHADAYRIARKYVEQPPGEIARREALRLLAADAASKPVFEKILRDKTESPDLRRMSASALNVLAPDSLQKHARAIVMDPSESDELQAACLTAIAQFGDGKAIAADSELKKRVNRLSGAKSSPQVKRGAKQFLARYAVE